MNLYMNHVDEEMLKKDRKEILTATQEDIRALEEIAKAVLADDQICVIGNESKIEEDREVFTEVKDLF